MITGTIKNKVDKIWTDIWAGGITNPLTVIEQLTYLMFIRSLDEKELETEEFENMTGEASTEKIFPQTPSGQAMRWSKFKDRDPRDIYDLISQRVFPAIKNFKNGKLPDFTVTGEMIEVNDADSGSTDDTAFSRYMSDAMFLIPKDSVSKQNSISSKYTVCLANPPFKGTIDAESINDNLKAVTNTKKTELLFLPIVNIERHEMTDFVTDSAQYRNPF